MKKYFLPLFLLCVGILYSGEKAMSQVINYTLNAQWEFKERGTDTWHKATVPGCVQTDLFANKLIPDPFYRLNERDLQWIDKRDWVYYSQFDVAPETFAKQNIILDFKGLDTYATVTLNGKTILVANNMFREWLVDCKEILKPSGNELNIEFESVINKTLPIYDAMSFHYPSPNDQSEIGGLGDKKVGMLTRKAGYNFGWDWGPRFITAGIWRPIDVIAYDDIRLVDVYAVTNSATKSQAELSTSVEIKSEITGVVQVEIWFDNKLIKSTDVELQRGKMTYELTFPVNNPQLWWCNGLGTPFLYPLKSVLKKGDKIIDQKEIKIGIRTVEVVHQPDKEGRSFYFKLNGIPVFMKGANYIPIDNFPARISKSRYREVINSAVDANMNMLRVWGGGIYENDYFYELCDENGILVWQDFMFACTLFPGDNAFLENIHQEAIDNVRRLRNHPSIALWCGNNEIHTAWFGWGWKSNFEKESPELAQKLWHDYDTIFNKILANVVTENDKQRFYWPSSPMATFDQKAGDLSSGDIHYWDVWHFAKPFEEYTTNVGRFMSEYGFQSFPAFSSVKKYTEPGDYSIESEVMMAHQRHPRGNQLIKTYLGYYYKTPKDFESFLYMGQVLQAEGIKLAVETHRSAMPRCMGTLYWQLNDCWPVASWSSTDYYGKWKAQHYFMKKAYKPLLIVTTANDKGLDVSLVSDKLEDITTFMTCRIISFDGKELWKTQLPATFKANTATKLTIDLKPANLTASDKKKCLIVVSVDSKALDCEQSIEYFNHPKDLDFPKPIITRKIEKKGSTYSITLTTDKLAKTVFIEIPGEGFLSDNYFDMLPGETKTVEVSNSDVEIKDTELKIKTIVDSFLN